MFAYVCFVPNNFLNFMIQYFQLLLSVKVVKRKYYTAFRACRRDEHSFI